MSAFILFAAQAVCCCRLQHSLGIVHEPFDLVCTTMERAGIVSKGARFVKMTRLRGALRLRRDTATRARNHL